MKPVLAVLVAAALSLSSSTALALPEALTPFKAEPLANAPKSLDAFDHQVLVVGFWASWCSVCRKAMPAYMRIAEQFHDKGVQFIAISVDEDKQKAIEHLKTEKYPVPVYYDTQDLKGSLLLQGVPVIIVYDRDNQQVVRFGGHDEKRERMLLKVLTRLTEKQPG